MSDEYKSAVVRINKANDPESLKKLDASLDRIYNAGFFTANEYGMLCVKIMEKACNSKK